MWVVGQVIFLQNTKQLKGNTVEWIFIVYPFCIVCTKTNCLTCLLDQMVIIIIIITSTRLLDQMVIIIIIITSTYLLDQMVIY